MAYTDTWDVTAPLDTQAANQGAADFRATKLDIMQRVASFGAGLLAARPTPETTSGTADWTGVMYWATDTKQVFMWTGTAWTDISTEVPTGASIPTVTQKQGSGGGAYTTSSGVPVNVDGVNLTYTVVIPVGWKLLIATSGFFTPGGVSYGGRVYLSDGGVALVQSELFVSNTITSGGVQFALNWVITGDGLSHTITLQFGGGGTMSIDNAGTFLPVMTFFLTESN